MLLRCARSSYASSVVSKATGSATVQDRSPRGAPEAGTATATKARESPTKHLKRNRPLNVSIASPKHDDEGWIAMNPVVRDAVVCQPDLVCPDMTATCNDLLRDVVTGTILGSEDGRFRGRITAQRRH
jgi:hypothetical protein